MINYDSLPDFDERFDEHTPHAKSQYDFSPLTMRELRKAQGSSLQVVADALHTTKSQIHYYETGRYTPQADTWQAIVDYWGCIPRDLQEFKPKTRPVFEPPKTYTILDIDLTSTDPESNNLKACREYFKLSQAQLASMLGVDRKTYCNWETSKRFMPPKHYQNLLNVLHIPQEAMPFTACQKDMEILRAPQSYKTHRLTAQERADLRFATEPCTNDDTVMDRIIAERTIPAITPGYSESYDDEWY